jgi:hypothetical protein
MPMLAQLLAQSPEQEASANANANAAAAAAALPYRIAQK